VARPSFFSLRRPNLVERRLSKFLNEPPTVASAARVIVGATAVVTAAGGVLIRFLDHSEYGNVWLGMWWALQTATTVGYGDVTPANVSGRIVGVVVMLWGLAFLAIITAIITTTFITRARIEQQVGVAGEVEGAAEADATAMNARFDAIETKLESLERAIRESAPRERGA
jgi:voltage-gated potassium channel